MKRLLLLTAILALTITAAGCSGAEKPLSPSEEISQSETTSTSAETEQAEETAPPLTEPPPSEIPEPTAADSKESEKSVVNEEFVLTTVSPDNVFVDYTYIRDAEYSTDEAQFSEEIAEAVSVIVNTEDFSAVQERYAADINAAFNYSADEEITALSSARKSSSQNCKILTRTAFFRRTAKATAHTSITTVNISERNTTAFAQGCTVRLCFIPTTAKK